MFWLKRLGSCAIVILICFLIDALTHRMFGSYEQRIVALIGIYVILAVSLNLINGIAGQFSIGHAAFYQIGAYLSGYVSRTWISVHGHSPRPIPWLIGMILIGALGASIAGFVVGLPSLRLRGDYLAIVTLGFGEIIRIQVQNTDALGGAYALDKIPKMQYIWLVWLVAFICIAVCRNLLKTGRGLTFLAVREDEIASQAMGVNVTRVKVTAFVIGSAFAGAAGALLAHYEGLITPQTFTMDVSFIILTMVVLGGTGSITGSVVAAIFLSYLPEYLRNMKGADGQALVVSGSSVVACLVVTGVTVAVIKNLMERQIWTPRIRGAAYVGIVIAAVILERITAWALTPIAHLESLQANALALLLVGGLGVLAAKSLWARLELALPIRSSICGAVVLAALLLEPVVEQNFKPIQYLSSMQIESSQLRMVIFAATLIVLMLLRPQGLFAHHEFSWDWVKKVLGRGPGSQTEVSA